MNHADESAVQPTIVHFGQNLLTIRMMKQAVG